MDTTECISIKSRKVRTNSTINTDLSNCPLCEECTETVSVQAFGVPPRTLKTELNLFDDGISNKHGIQTSARVAIS